MNKTDFYKLGYRAATNFNWSSVPVDTVFNMIDRYKGYALYTENSYFNGLADGAYDSIKDRLVAA